MLRFRDGESKVLDYLNVRAYEKMSRKKAEKISQCIS